MVQLLKRKLKAPGIFFLTDDLIGGICNSAVQIQQKFDTTYEKQAMDAKLQLDKNRVPLDTSFTRIAMPERLQLASFKVEPKVDFKTRQ